MMTCMLYKLVFVIADCKIAYEIFLSSNVDKILFLNFGMLLLFNIIAYLTIATLNRDICKANKL